MKKKDMPKKPMMKPKDMMMKPDEMMMAGKAKKGKKRA